MKAFFIFNESLIHVYNFNFKFQPTMPYIYIYTYVYTYTHFPGGSSVKESACSAGDLGLIPGLGISPGERNGNPFQYSCLENSMDEPGRLQSMGSQRVRHD